MALFPRKHIRNHLSLRQFYKKHVVAISISCILVILFIFAIILILNTLNVLHISNIKVWVTVFLSIGLPLVGVATPLVQWLHSLYMEERRASIDKKLPQAEQPVSTKPATRLYPPPEPLSAQKAKKKALRVDWGEAPQISQFYGRERELLELEQWIVIDKCQFISILGIGGIGKTALTVKIMERVLGSFEYALWYELKNAPPLENVLKKCLLFFSNHQYVEIPEDNDEKITLLCQYLQTHRCLLVLDNMETILQSGSQTGKLRNGYEVYSRLITRIALQKHQSCVIVTSREKPNIIAQLDGTTSLIRSLQLSGLAQQEASVILKDKGLKGTEEEWKILINRYSGNPLALRLVSQFINEVFSGNISEFLLDGNIVFTDIEDVLSQQFQRLSPLEQEVMYWLAIERQAIPPNKILEYTIHPLTRRTLQEAWRSLRRRHLIEPVNDGFTLQNVIMEYMTEGIVARVAEEIIAETFTLFESHALMQAQVKDYIRNSQSHVILKPIIDRLLLVLGENALEQHLSNILVNLRKMLPKQKSYIAGNVINLLIQYKSNLRGYDFSHLVIRQAYLRGISLVDVNFAYANISASLFTEAFQSVSSVAFSPDGVFLAAGTTNGEVRLWDVLSGTPLLSCKGHTDWVRSVMFSPDSKLLVSCSEDFTVRLWECSTGNCLYAFHGHTNRVKSVSFHQNGHTIASGSEDQTIRLWDTTTGDCLQVLKGHTGGLWSVMFSPDGSQLVSCGEDCTVRLWDITTKENTAILSGHTDWVFSVAFSPDGYTLASSSEDQTVRLWDVRSARCVKILHGHTDRIRTVAFSSDGRLLATGGDDQFVRLWSVHTGEALMTLQGHTNLIRSVAFSPDGSILASGGTDQTIRLWNVQSGEALTTLQGYVHLIRSISFNKEGTLLASGGTEQVIRLWYTHTGQSNLILHGHTNPILSVTFSPNDLLLASGSDDRTVRLWSPVSGECLATLHGHGHGICSVAFSPDCALLATSSYDPSIRIWTGEGKPLSTLQGHRNRIWSVAFSPDCKLLASGSEDQTIRLWNTQTWECIHELHGHTNGIWSIAFRPDGKCLASGCSDQTIRVWNTATGECTQILHGHTHWIRSVAFSPDGNYLASGGSDRTIRLWNASTWECVATLEGHTDQIWSIAFHPTKSLLASSGSDGLIKIWDLAEGRCLQEFRCDRPYERMNITGVTGLTEDQKQTLKVLGATEASESVQGEDL